MQTDSCIPPAQPASAGPPLEEPEVPEELPDEPEEPEDDPDDDPDEDAPPPASPDPSGVSARPPHPAPATNAQTPTAQAIHRMLALAASHVPHGKSQS
jgi:hypothetical protein